MASDLHLVSVAPLNLVQHLLKLPVQCMTIMQRMKKPLQVLYLELLLQVILQGKELICPGTVE